MIGAILSGRDKFHLESFMQKSRCLCRMRSCSDWRRIQVQAEIECGREMWNAGIPSQSQ